MTTEVAAVLVHLEAFYIREYCKAKLDASLTSKMRRDRMSHAMGALQALVKVRELLMAPEKLPPIAEHVVEMSK